MFNCIASRISKTWLRNFSSSKSSGSYLNTVLKITFPYGGEEISENILMHAAYDYSNTLNNQVQSSTLEFIKRHLSTTKKDIERSNAVSNYSLTACPNLTVDQYVILSNAAAVHLLIDEIFDDELLDTKHTAEVERMCKILCKYFRCEAIPIDDKIHEISPKFESICRMYGDVGQSLLATGRDTSWMYHEFENFINSYVTEVKLPRPSSPEEYLERKIDAFGMRFYFELVSVLAGESISTEIRNSAWFKEFQSVTATLPPLYCDLTSFIYDISIGRDSDNYTVIRTKQGASVKKAFKETITRYNQLFIDSVMLISKLDNISISAADKKCLSLYLDNINGGLDWAINYGMYNTQSKLTYLVEQNPILAADCVADVLRAVPKM